MSTEPTRRSRTRARRSKGFFAAFAIVSAVLIGLGVTGAAVSLVQGPRVTGVQVDPAAAVEESGTRLILTANQALEPIDDTQVSVDPEVPFTVDASGRSVGVRFTVPLDDDTRYTVTVEGAQGVGGGPATTLTHEFATPPAVVYLLQRGGSGDDAIFRTDLGGERAVPVFTHERIEDFRATSNRLVVSVDDGEQSAIIVAGLDGSDPRELTLPGDGFVTSLQVSAKADLVGYTYSDREISETTGRESVVYTSPLSDPDAEPTPIEIADAATSIAEWRFVPDTSAILLIDFAGDLLLTDPAVDADPTALGTALTIDGITRGTYQAIVERSEGIVVIDLTDAAEVPLVPAEGGETAADGTFGELGVPGTVTPVPGGGTVRFFTSLDDAGLPAGQSVMLVGDDGSVDTLLEVPTTGFALQSCVSPSGRYAAILVAPDLVSNPYDGYRQPLPENLETHVIELSTGEERSALNGFAISWCPTGAA